MSTLIASSTSGGRSRRCTSRCYNARRPECECLCLGANHGVGERQAQENTRKMGVAWIQQANRTRCYRKRMFTLAPEQGDLFSTLPTCVEPSA
jgi:hypothetical protein